MAIADITAKNAAAANVVFKALAAGTQDSPAIFKATTLGGASALQPVLEVRGTTLAKAAGQRVAIKLVVPYVVTNAGVSDVIDVVPFYLEGPLRGTIPDSVIADAVAYLTSILPDVQIQASLKTGFAPR